MGDFLFLSQDTSQSKKQHPHFSDISSHSLNTVYRLMIIMMFNVVLRETLFLKMKKGYFVDERHLSDEN